jgi:hypothetical protein
LQPSSPDSAYIEEAKAATENGFSYELFDFDALTSDDIGKALRKIRTVEEPAIALYRGWMLTPTQYQQLHFGLTELGLNLINSPDEYSHCHWFPNSYPVIEENTPLSYFIPRHQINDWECVHQCVEKFGDQPIVVKDYVKSRKHDWYEACFIPDASDWSHVQKVVARFIELQGESLNGGLVFREFVELKPIGVHAKSQMPLTKEIRRFYLQGKLLFQSPYWNSQIEEEMPPPELFENTAKKVQSHFFTMDIAQKTNDEWIIVELGDGQVAGLPSRISVSEFYFLLSTHFKCYLR